MALLLVGSTGRYYPQTMEWMKLCSHLPSPGPLACVVNIRTVPPRPGAPNKTRAPSLHHEKQNLQGLWEHRRRSYVLGDKARGRFPSWPGPGQIPTSHISPEAPLASLAARPQKSHLACL